MALNLAKEVEQARENLQLDLKGFNITAASEFVNSAFATERTLSEMFRVTLQVGAGKGDRAKYNDDLPKWIMNALRDAGYNEDRGASVSFLCAGSFKYQHDTGKNLKFVHVFPKATEGGGDEDGGGDEGDDVERTDECPEGISPAEWYIIISGLDVFKKMAQKKMPAWMQKKRCSAMLKSIQEEINEGERKMMNMKEMSSRENTLYTEAEDLSGKIQLLQEEMKVMVDDGKLTRQEIDTLKDQIDEKLKKIEEGLAAAKGKIAIDKLMKAKDNATKRKEKISKIEPYVHPLKDEKDIKKLLTKILPLKKLEDKAGSKGLWSNKLSSTEVAALKEKETLDCILKSKLEAAMAWFENDEEFRRRYERVVGVIKTKLGQKSSKANAGASRGGSKGKTSAGGWSTVGNGNNKKKIDFNKLIKKKPNTGGFNALMD